MELVEWFSIGIVCVASATVLFTAAALDFETHLLYDIGLSEFLPDWSNDDEHADQPQSRCNDVGIAIPIESIRPIIQKRG